jgi:molybdopterin/thiamine biosynthesis adenylyltransferase
VRGFFLSRQRNERPHDEFYEPATTSLIAGVIANECLKYITHHLLPMAKQWYLYGRSEVFDWDTGKTRMDLFEHIRSMSVAIVGIGATGCETAKLLALSGIRRIALIDPDHIETTNLNRQVLFTDSDVGRNKAAAAAALLREVRPALEIEVFEHFMNDETEAVFNDDWLAEKNAFFAMVDSFDGRAYIDQRCAPSKIPMFTGGIDRVTADWQSIIPDQTPRYARSLGTQKTDTILSCTLKLFPYHQDHCIEWSHHQLNRLLKKGVSFTSFSDCLDTAIGFIVKKFIFRIKDLQYFHPKGEIVSGALYWSRHRIYPTELDFDPSNPYIQQLLGSAATLMARASGVEPEEIDFLAITPVLEWKPLDEGHRPAYADSGDVAEITENKFEHDNEIHLDFIEAASNLRSSNYGLGEISRLDCQLIAGRIEPAISTTASICAAGSVTEFLVSQLKPDFAQRGKFVASPFSLMTFRECSPPLRKLGDTDKMFSPWDFFKFDGRQTLEAAEAVIEEQANRKMASWVTTTGMLLPVKGGRIARSIPLTMTFNELFQEANGRIEIDVCLEMSREEQLVVPRVLVTVNHPAPGTAT